MWNHKTREHLKILFLSLSLCHILLYLQPCNFYRMDVQIILRGFQGKRLCNTPVKICIYNKSVTLCLCIRVHSSKFPLQ